LASYRLVDPARTMKALVAPFALTRADAHKHNHTHSHTASSECKRLVFSTAHPPWPRMRVLSLVDFITRDVDALSLIASCAELVKLRYCGSQPIGGQWRVVCSVWCLRSII